MFNEVIEKINSAKKIAIFNHISPDVDAHGSAFGLKLCLLALGKQAEVFLESGDDLTQEYKLIKGTETQGLLLEDCDLKIAVDCADKGRLGAFADSFSGETVAIDHHITHSPFAKTTLVVPSSPATGEIIFDLAEKMNVSITHDIAYNLYLAIVCDTGSFKFSSTTSHTHIVAAKLMETGIDISDMTKKLFDTKTFEYLEIYKTAIEKLEMYNNGTIALLALTDKDFEKANISEADADGVVTIPINVSGVEVGVYIRSRNNGFKVSLRSNGKVNVSKIAAEFGGGGHERASGFSLDISLNEAKKTVVERLTKSINGDTE